MRLGSGSASSPVSQVLASCGGWLSVISYRLSVVGTCVDILWILHGYALQDDKSEGKPVWNKTWIELQEQRNRAVSNKRPVLTGRECESERITNLISQLKSERSSQSCSERNVLWQMQQEAKICAPTNLCIRR